MQAQIHFQNYSETMQRLLQKFDWGQLEKLTNAILSTHLAGGTVFICGNGGSAANAMHIANDLLYGSDMAIKCEALPANVAVVSCLANDEGYEQIFAHQLQVKASKGDMLLVLSGSGNSANVVEALKTARTLGLTTAAIVGFSGGRCKMLAQHVLHVDIDDMQIAEDFQMIFCHMLTQWLAMVAKQDQRGQAGITVHAAH